MPEEIDFSPDGSHLVARTADGTLDTWTVDMMNEEIRRSFGEDEVVVTRGSIIQGSFAHDVYHTAELNETLKAHGLPFVDLWS